MKTGVQTRISEQSYRPEIDGLRAIAILPVVLFHTGFSQASGGFVGVDIFFVISGFLITGILINEFDRNGRISIVNFYARRIRRLLPAILVVLAFTAIASIFLLPASGERQSFALSGIAALTFVSNFFSGERTPAILPKMQNPFHCCIHGPSQLKNNFT